MPKTQHPRPSGATAPRSALPHHREQALVWIAVAAVLAALVCAAILLTAELSRWAFATTARTIATSTQPFQPIVRHSPAAADDST